MNSSQNFIKIVFFVSDFSALIYQIAWQRMLFQAFGVDLEATTIIISIFMAGLGVGGYFGGRIADRFPTKLLLIFALIECGIGVFGLLSPILIHFIQDTFLLSSKLIIALANFILLIIPTFLMGATLPLLTSYLNQRDNNTGNNIGWLYFANTIGAMTACLMTSFVLFLFLTLNQTIYLAGLINLIIASMIAFIYFNKKVK